MVFGTYVFHEVANAYLQTQGIATDESGKPQANRWVSLKVNGKTYGTQTDARGRYAIYSSNSTEGIGKLSVGKRILEVKVRPIRTRPDVPVLRLERPAKPT
jgi:hypothetical protein